MSSIINLFESCVEKYADLPYLLQKNGSPNYEALSYAQTKEQVEYFAAGLHSIGIQKGDRLALLSEGRNSWVISEIGILYNGALNVPLSVKLNEQEILFRINHSGATYFVVSNNQLEKVQSIRKEAHELKGLILLDDKSPKQEGDFYFNEIIEAGKKAIASNPDLIADITKRVNANDEANICYTSGTTADPKGIVLTHRNYTANVEQSIKIVQVQPNTSTLLILPWDHAFAHTCGVYAIMASGASIASIEVGSTPMETLKNIPKNIKEIKPHFLLSVPALAKNFRKNIEKSIREKGKFTENLFNHALKIAYKYNGNGFNKGKGLRFIYKPLLSLYDKIIFSKVREGFGGNLEFFVGGGALLDIELQKFFYALGMPMMQGYGLSEAAPVISANSEKYHKMGSSGKIVEDLEIKITDEDGNNLPPLQKGEIVVKGENVMKGYWRNEEASSEALKDGWLHTGDLGYFDKDGFLYVLGRFKSLLISDDGEKFSPEGIEEAMSENSKLIDQVMLYNNQNPYTIALLVPNMEAVKRTLKESGNSTNIEAKDAIKIIEEELNEYRTGKYKDMFPQRWLPSAIGILPEAFTEENNMVNSTMKIVRPKITEHYTDLIEYLYTPEAKDIQNKYNTNNVSSLLN
jgi:long-chain acyl-CoA synthetase